MVNLSHDLCILCLYVAQDIERSDYLERRRLFMSEKKSVEEQISRLLRTPSMWIEPTREWIKDASILDEIAKTNDLPQKKPLPPKNLRLEPHPKKTRSVRKSFATLRRASLCSSKFY